MKRKQMLLGICALMVCAFMLTTEGESLAAQRKHREPEKFDIVRVYTDINYRGRSQVLKEGQYRLADLRIENDSLSSLHVAKGYQVVLFEHDNFRGRQRVITEDTSWVGNVLDNKTSSIIVKKIPRSRRQ